MATHKHKTKKVTPHHKKEHHSHHHAKHERKSQPRTMAIIIGGGLVLGFVFVMMNYSIMTMDKTYTSSAKPAPQAVSDEEKKRIQQWIIDENLNAYGDKKRTFYIGGTPLFDEKTGKYSNLYDYLFEQHPDRPWNN